jgi:hypothetical protein
MMNWNYVKCAMNTDDPTAVNWEEELSINENVIMVDIYKLSKKYQAD